MAAGDGVRRFVRLVLDKTGVKKFQSESQRAINRGTDPKKAEKNLSRIDRGFARLKKAALALGSALAVAFGVRAIIRFGKEAVRVAAESEAIWNRLAGQLRIAGVEFRNVEGEIRGAARALQDTTRVGDEDFAAVLTELLSTTNDYAASLAEIETVANLAAAKQIDLRTAAQLVGRAMVGQTGTLTRYGIIVQEGADVMEVLRERFAGMARNEARSLDGQIAMLNNEWADFKQAVGDAMIAAGGGTSIMETLIGTVKGMTTWVNENRMAIARWGSLFIEVLKAVGQTAAGIFNLVRSLFGVTAAELVRITRQAQLEVAHVIDFIAKGVNLAIEGLNKLPGVDIDFRMAGQPIEQFEAMRNEAVRDVERELGNLSDALVQIGDGWIDVWEKARMAEQAQRDAAAAGAGGSGGGGGGGGTTIPSVGRRDVGTPRQPIPGVPAGVPTPVPVSALIPDAPSEQRVQEILDQTRMIESAMHSAAANVTLAWEHAFGLMFSGFANVQDAALALGKGIAGALIGGVADYAGAKVAENVALAFEEHAKGTAALANPFLAWTAPIHFAAAKGHVLSAAKWAALSGLAGAAGSAVSGGGGGTRVGGGGTNRLAPGFEGERQGPEVHIYLDPFDPDSPLHQRQVGRAAAIARQRFGEQVPVKIHHGRRSDQV